MHHGSLVYIPIDDKSKAISIPMKAVYTSLKRMVSSDGKDILIPDEEQVENNYIDEEELPTSITIAPQVADIKLMMMTVGIQDDNVIDIYRGEKRKISLAIQNISTNLDIENFSIYSDISIRINASSVSNIFFANTLAN